MKALRWPNRSSPQHPHGEGLQRHPLQTYTVQPRASHSQPWGGQLQTTATDVAFASGEAGAAAAAGIGVVRVRAPGGPPASYAGFSPHRATKESEGPTSCPHSTLLQSGIEWVKNAV